MNEVQLELDLVIADKYERRRAALKSKGLHYSDRIINALIARGWVYDKSGSIGNSKVLYKKVKVAIGIRINPDIAAKTNKKISTGKKSDKFGISINHCEAIFNKYKLNKFISIQAISVHIGSQIKNINPFEKTLKVVDLFLKKLKQKNIKINYLDIGGGMGIAMCVEKAA